MCVAKGLTGGFLPLAATLTTERVHDALPGPTATRFLSRTLVHGQTRSLRRRHANLHISTPSRFLSALPPSNKCMPRASPEFAAHPGVADVRHIGSVAAIELKVPDAGYLFTSPAPVRVLPKSRSSTPASRKRCVISCRPTS